MQSMVLENKQDCCGCYACIHGCPNSCIDMKIDKEGFWYPVINTTLCIECNKCRQVCPALKKEEKEQGNKSPKAYAVINRDENIRFQSSSGGVFTAVAEWVLGLGGVVFGAAFSENFRNLQHIEIETSDELWRLRGSKYLQSKIGNAYIKTIEYLENGRWVLFSGTPCQIEGLKSYLKKDYEKLICVDIICHGVPSPKVWGKYLEHREIKDKGKASDIDFRCKMYGWKEFCLQIKYVNGGVVTISKEKDYFMKCFLENICLRPSCYTCHFKKLNRVSDITLADFWGIQSMMPQIDDDKGVSLVLVHSDKGYRILQLLQESVTMYRVDEQKAIEGNGAMIRSVWGHSKRDPFFDNLDKKSFDKLVLKYVLPNQNKEFVKCILKRIGLLEWSRRILKCWERK